jgi:hypothetical protein
MDHMTVASVEHGIHKKRLSHASRFHAREFRGHLFARAEPAACPLDQRVGAITAMQGTTPLGLQAEWKSFLGISGQTGGLVMGRSGKTIGSPFARHVHDGSVVIAKDQPGDLA